MSFSLDSVKRYYWPTFLVYINPERDAHGAGFMYIRLKEVMSSAGWFGTYGDTKFIPAGDTDFVFASLTYYYGVCACAKFPSLFFLFL